MEAKKLQGSQNSGLRKESIQGKPVPVSEPGPSPQDVTFSHVTDVSTTNQKRHDEAEGEAQPDLKRLKSSGMSGEQKLYSETPEISSELTPRMNTNEGTSTQAPEVKRAESTAPISSEISSMSASSYRNDSASPLPPSYAQEVPPAPPSTPASQASLIGWDGSATPLPILRSVENAAFLEQQQLLSEGAVTPAPPRPQYESDPKAPALPEDFSDWAVGERYEMVRMLGRGSYGEVAQAIDKSAGRPDSFVAIKRVHAPFDQEVDAIRLYREIHILRRLRGHECVIQLLDIIPPPSDDIDDFIDLYMVFEYVDTDLYKLIMSPQYLTTEHIQTFLYQMLVGLKYLHSSSVIHRDLKPANILLNEDCSLKVCDFGLARIVDGATMSSTSDESKSVAKVIPGTPTSFSEPPKTGLTRQLTKHVVTRWYRAPELILIQPYSSAVDIWSLGCILAELLSMQEGNVAGYQDRQPLFPGGYCYPLSGEGDKIKADERLDQLNVIFKVIGTPAKNDINEVAKSNQYIESIGKMKGKPFEALFPAADPLALDLLRRMLQFNPRKRCTADEAIQHDFFKGIRRHELERNAEAPLACPEFLDAHKIDLAVLKRKTFEEVIWFRDHRN